ncbi:MAG: prolipoprotein diacylglyceryl transferase [Firmicutes bacterium]|nr:prolipoprotein diacylglyceryl transferase [Bacillota bacterium]
MPQWLNDILRQPLIFDTLSYAIFALAMIFLFVSRRMNVRLETPATPWLPLLVDGFLAKENPSQVSLKLIRPLLKLYLLFQKKLKLLPDMQTGRRLNLFILLYLPWALIYAERFFTQKNKWIQASVFIGRIQQTEISLTQLLFVVFLISISLVLFLLPFFFIRTNREFYFDLSLLIFFLYIALQKLDCIRLSCCFGFLWAGPGAVYNTRLGTTVFPVQLLEFSVGILCFVLCVFYMLFAKFYKPGRVCSLSVFLYAVTRFFVDYLRYRDENYYAGEDSIIFGLSMAQIICIIASVLAIAWLFILPLEKKLMDRFWLFVTTHVPKRNARG